MIIASPHFRFRYIKSKEAAATKISNQPSTSQDLSSIYLYQVNPLQYSLPT